MTRIVVDLGWVADLRTRTGDATDQLRTAPSDVVSLPSAPVLDSGMSRFMRRWDSRSGELADCLESVHEFLEAVHTGFGETDAALADAGSGADQ